MTPPTAQAQAGRWTYAALFLVALATLMYEVLLTRIFSVTMYYHFAFVAVSVALFGMTLGAVIVYLFPRTFAPGSPHTQRQMAISSLLFGVTVLLTFIAHLKLEYASLAKPEDASPFSLVGTYCLIAIPFIFSGISVCLALTRFTHQVSRLYAADLAGAALGCILFVLALKLTDGPTAVLIVATLAILAALCSALDAGSRILVPVTAVCLVAAGGLAWLNAARVQQINRKSTENLPRTAGITLRGRYVAPPPPVRIEHAKGSVARPPIYERWNSFSRIHVRREKLWMEEMEPSGWGMSPKYLDDPAVPRKTTSELFIGIDAGAGTYMTRFQPTEALELLAYAEDHDSLALYCHDEAFNREQELKKIGTTQPAERAAVEQAIEDFRRLKADAQERAAGLRRQAVRHAVKAAQQQAGFLRYDVTNFAHLLRPGSRVLVIGSGGGRDILSALVFDQRHVIGVELNDAIIHAMRDVFGDFTGHLARLPNVEIAHDEARSYITRMSSEKSDKVDIIQISLIDTWAATAAGAFVLSENSLYTVEAWKTFLNHLTDRGVITVSRWYHPKTPGETLRMVSLANQALREIGVTDPRRHLLIVKRDQPQMSTDLPSSVATIIASRSPLSPEDLTLAVSEAQRMGFDLLLDPREDKPSQKDLQLVAGSPNPYETAKQFAINIAPPTDDKPFFFNMTRMRDAFTPSRWQGQGHDINLKAVMVLAGLLVFVIALTAILVITPVLIKAEKGTVKSNLALSAFFVCIGLAFILVEIAQMQRLIILLGHPTYSLSVVLFAVLVSSGIGSYLTQSGANIAPRMIALIAILVLTGLLTPALIDRHVASPTALRIAIALILLMPAGLFMGMCFPLGMQVAATRRADLTAWLWGINGAMSVVASVLSVVISMTWGISTTWWTGVVFYTLALLSITRALSNSRPPPSVTPVPT